MRWRRLRFYLSFGACKIGPSLFYEWCWNPRECSLDSVWRFVAALVVFGGSSSLFYFCLFSSGSIDKLGLSS